MYRNGIDDFKIINAKVEAPVARDFIQKCKKNKISQSEVIREFIRMFLSGEVKIVKTIGG